MTDPSQYAAAHIFEELLASSERAVDRAMVRRVLRESTAAFPGDDVDTWWRRVSEAGTTLGLKCKVVDCTPRELRSLAQEGARVIVYVPGADPWRAVTGVRGSTFRLVRASDEHEPQWGDAAKLRSLLGNPRKHDTLRCVVVEPSLAYPDATDDHGEMTPLRRLFALLQPEAGDILAMIVLAMFAPWQQSLPGRGNVVAYAPLERQQTIEAPIKGRIVRWGDGIIENARVVKGQMIAEMQDLDPLFTDRLKSQLEASRSQLAASQRSLAATQAA